MTIKASAGCSTFHFKEEDKWFLSILDNAIKTNFYGELNLKFENGVIVIADEVKKHKPKRKR